MLRSWERILDRGQIRPERLHGFEKREEATFAGGLDDQAIAIAIFGGDFKVCRMTQ